MGKCKFEEVSSRRETRRSHGKIAIIVDDDIATGFTMRLAVKTIKSQHPEKIIVAVPAAHSESIHELKEEG
ncbi:MAG: phosphoribosyltransferase family protein [Patescibacteria group bacterium]